MHLKNPKKSTQAFAVILSFIFVLTMASAVGGSGSIWTTEGDCGDFSQDVNHYTAGELVFINGDNFPEAIYNWTITGTPGSCDSNTIVASGDYGVDSSGEFCLDAYNVSEDDCGVYKVGFNGKGDNYQVVISENNATCTDADQDGYYVGGEACGITDCDDNNASINPGAEEVCNLVDDNCNQQIDEGLECDEPQEGVCPFDEGEYDHVVDFNPNTKMRSDINGSGYSTGIESVSLPAGTYEVSLYSWDGYENRGSSSQPNEKYKVLFFDNGTNIINSSDSTDLADNVVFAQWQGMVDSNLVLLNDVDSVQGYHSVYYDPSSPNSLYAECAAFNEVDQPQCETNNDCSYLDTSCGEGICSKGECIYLSEGDDEGPTISDFLVEKIPGACGVTINATATDTCSPIEEAEYFVGSCGLPGTGSSMDAVDGTFNELEEAILKHNVFNGVSDGNIDIYVRAKDSADENANWGACAQYSISIDCLPPYYPACEVEDVGETGEDVGFVIDEVCDAQELLICDDNPTLSAWVCDDQSDIQAAEYFINEDQPLNWQGFPMNATDGSFYDERCEEVEAEVNITELAEGTHYLKLHAKDTQENWGKFYKNYNVSFIKDTTAPMTYKTLSPADNISLECSGEEYSLPGDVTLTNGCAYVKAGTNISLEAHDYNPDNDANDSYNDLPGEYAGDVMTKYKLWWSEDCKTNWTEGSETVHLGGPIELQEDSCHLIEYWSVDGCFEEEEHHFELDIVDTQAPETTIEILGPKYYDESEDKMYLDGVTHINLTCIDSEPHPVNDVILKYRYFVEGELVQDWTHYQGPFSFPEESNHTLEYYCYDALNNTEMVHSKTYFVDHTKPITNKTYAEPMVKIEGVKYITSNTSITLTADDGDEVHDSGVNYTQYRVSQPLADRFCEPRACENWMETLRPNIGPWNTYENPFTIPEESCHVIEYRSVDNVEKTEEIKWQCTFVDNSAPEVGKDISGPQVMGEEPVHYYLTNESSIHLTCNDVEPHPVGNETLYWEMYWSENNLTDWELIENGTESQGYKEITDLEDSYHKLIYWCEDALGNMGEKETEIDAVDNLAPNISKEVGEPKIECSENEECHYYVSQETNFTFTCEDIGPHPVNDVTMYVEAYWNPTGEEWQEEPIHTWEHNGNNFTINHHEDSLHKFVYWCEDSLGNSGEVMEEIDNVDTNGPKGWLWNPLGPREVNTNRCSMDIVLEAIDEKSGLNESNVMVYLYNESEDLVLTDQIWKYGNLKGTGLAPGMPEGGYFYSGLLNLDGLEAGEYLLVVTMVDNLGNERNITKEIRLKEGVHVEYLYPAECSVSMEEGGECELTFNTCVRGSSGVKMWMEKINNGAVDPFTLGANIEKFNETAYVGLLQSGPFIGRDARVSEADLLNLSEISCEEINGIVDFDFKLNFTQEIAELVGSGAHPIEYELASYNCEVEE